jgi:redox-sensitive bicupin YhaK (pirin superfamily)
MRGNSMQASQVWLNMSPEDRMKFARGEGIQPDQATEKRDIQQMMMKHSENQSGEASGNTAQMEEQVPTPLGASLQQLPGIDSSSPAN